MKELVDFKSEIKEICAEIPAKTEKIVGSLRPYPGQKIWKLDLNTRLITEAEYEFGDIRFENAIKGDTSVRHKLLTEPGCLYVAAVNAKNADKKFFKMLKLKYPNK